MGAGGVKACGGGRNHLVAWSSQAQQAAENVSPPVRLRCKALYAVAVLQITWRPVAYFSRLVLLCPGFLSGGGWALLLFELRLLSVVMRSSAIALQRALPK